MQTTPDRNMKELTDKQIKMLAKMLEWDIGYYYPYFYFDDLFDDKTLRKEMRGLISGGYVNLMRGGLNEDGEVVGGSGFSLNYERRNEIEEIVKDSIK